jgi:pantothenate kinase, type III
MNFDPSSKLKKTSWPESRLVPNETQFISISLGNTSLHWAFHGEKENNLNPTFFWRTPQLTPEDVSPDTEQDLIQTFGRYLPERVIPFFFGGSATQSIQAARERNESRGHVPSIYLVSTNQEQTHLFCKLVSVIPCRVYELQPLDFFTPADGAYPGLGVDRMASLRGAISITGLPALVIDGGSAMTYTAADADGKIIGGGISPGLKMRFQALEDYTYGLPGVNIEKEVEGLIRSATISNTPADIFAKDTKTAMVVSSLNEISSHMRSVVDVWMSKVGGPKKRKSNYSDDQEKVDSVKQNNDRIVALAGGSGNLLAKLLDENDGGVINTLQRPMIRAKPCNGILHFGVAWVLCQKSNKPHVKPNISISNSQSNTADDDAISQWNKYIGQTVIKDFEAGGNGVIQTFKGQCVSYAMWKSDDDDDTVEPRPLFRVVYSDGDEEDLFLEELEREFLMCAFSSLFDCCHDCFSFSSYRPSIHSLNQGLQEEWPQSYRSKEESTRLYWF